MTRVEFIIKAADAARKRNPHITQKQGAAIGEKIAQREDAAFAPMWGWDAHTEMRDDYLALALTDIEQSAPELLRKAATREQYVALQLAMLEQKLGRPATAPERMTVARAAADLTVDDLLEKIPHGTKLPDTITQLSKAAAPVADDVEDLDAEVLRRWGKTPHQMTATDRLRYHNVIKAEARRGESAETNRAAALADAGGDFDKLLPAERMSRFRAAEKLKASNRP